MKLNLLTIAIASLISTTTVASEKDTSIVVQTTPLQEKLKNVVESPVVNIVELPMPKNPFSNIKGMESLIYNNDFEIWLHDQVFKTMKWCHENKFVPIEKIKQEWINAGTKSYGTWHKPNDNVGGLICNSIIETGISLKCNEPVKLFNKHSNIYTNKYNQKTILAHKGDIKHDIKFVGKSDCAYNKLIDVNTSYKATMFVEYNFDLLEEPTLQEVTLKDGKTKEMAYLGKAKLTPSNPIMKESERELVIVPHE